MAGPTAPSGKIPEKSNPFEGNLVGFGTTITVGAKVSTAINVAIQMQSGPLPLYKPGVIQAYLSDSVDGSTLTATVPDGGWAIGTNGLKIPIIVSKYATLISNAIGEVDITITMSSSHTYYLVVILPDGSQLISSAIVF